MLKPKERPSWIGGMLPDRRRKPFAWWQTLVADQFHRLLHSPLRHGDKRTPLPGSSTVHWLGHPINKCAFDLMILHELMVQVRPDIVIETGTYNGGSTLFIASMLDLINTGKVLSVDIAPDGHRPAHPRIRYYQGSSLDPENVRFLTKQASSAGACMVILDSANSREHVAAEIAAYADSVTVGSYLIVERTNLNGHPVSKRYGPGPMEAVEEFLKRDPRFVADREVERFFVSYNPSGYLKRIA